MCSKFQSIVDLWSIHASEEVFGIIFSVQWNIYMGQLFEMAEVDENLEVE